MNNKRGLGRGLGALLSSTPSEADTLVDLPIDQIHPGVNQPRKSFNSSSLEEMAASIRASGVIQPVIVRRVDGAYELIAGERRWRAARMAGLEHLPAIVRPASDAQSLELALVENLLREDLNPMEEAEAYAKLLAQFHWTQDALATRIGKDRSSIANALRLLRLPETIQEDLRDGRLTMGHARALLALDDAGLQMKLREEILAHSWSVRATEDQVRTVEPESPAPRRPKQGRRRSAELTALEGALQRALLTRVRIVGSERRGKIVVGYASPEELERLAGILQTSG
jgi:ParB family chromosome partitioning protein